MTRIRAQYVDNGRHLGCTEVMQSDHRCRLCLRGDADLQLSHIIPKWAYHRVRGDQQHGDPVIVSSGKAVQTSRQFRARMLCKSCEQRIGVVENEVSKLVYRADGTCFAFTFVGMKDVVPGATGPVPGGARLALLDPVLAKNLAHFATSVIWRCHVARGAMKGLTGTELGPYGEALRRYLLEAEPLSDAVAIHLGILDPVSVAKDGVRSMYRTVTFPMTDKDNGLRCHGFYLLGLQFCVYVGGRLPRWAQLLCLEGGAKKLGFVLPHESFGVLRKARLFVARAHLRGQLVGMLPRDRSMPGGQAAG